MYFRRPHAWPPIFWVAILASATALASDVPAFDVKPGPRKISAEEAALQADPNAGIQNAIILVDDTERNDAAGTLNEVRHHFRAKILSNEARDLANVEILLWGRGGHLRQWWGRSLLPDGEVLEVRRRDLDVLKVARVNREVRAKVYKAILPGVVPGAVIDYGYVARDMSRAKRRSVPIQLPYYVKKIRFAWRPAWHEGPLELHAHSLRILAYFCSALNLAHAEGLATKTYFSNREYVVEAEDVPPVVVEPLMPPLDVVRATATFYYTMGLRDPDLFWDAFARAQEKETRTFLGDGIAVRKQIRKMAIPADADLHAKLRLSYDWVIDNVRNTSIRTPEEREAEGEEATGEEPYVGEPQRKTAAEVLEAGEGTARDLDDLFIGIARALGADADITFAPDRTLHTWDPNLMTAYGQLDEPLVALRTPDDRAGDRTLLDPGSGLPYGEIPWWVSGTVGLMTMDRGSRQITIQGAGARKAVSETRAEIRFSDDQGTARVSWTVTGESQQGFDERHTLRALAPAKRADRLAHLCGSTDGVDVIRSKAPDLLKSGGPFHLECEGEIAAPAPSPEAGLYTFPFAGKWVGEVPVLNAPRRVHTVVFPYPRMDLTTVSVTAPPGFRPGPAPEPERIESPFGNYFLQVTRTDEGFKVERSLSLLTERIEPDRYSELRSFLSRVNGADRTRLEFERAGVLTLSKTRYDAESFDNLRALWSALSSAGAEALAFDE